MSVTIHKDDSDKAIRKAIQEVMNRKKERKTPLDRYFGKVSFGMQGLKYQKEIRDEWK